MPSKFKVGDIVYCVYHQTLLTLLGTSLPSSTRVFDFIAEEMGDKEGWILTVREKDLIKMCKLVIMLYSKGGK